jgi:hypothetical protein
VKAPRSGVCDAQQPSPFQAPNDVFMYTITELCSITTQYTTNNEVVKLHPAIGSWEVTPSSGKEALSDVTVHDAKKGAKGSKKRCK